MPTIVFASPKGGAGKSTAAVLLGTELAAKGGDVTIIANTVSLATDTNIATHPSGTVSLRPLTAGTRIHLGLDGSGWPTY